MKRKVLYTILIALTIALVAIFLIGLSADSTIADRSGGRSGGPSRGGGGHQQMNAPRQQNAPQRAHTQQARPQPQAAPRHMPPTEQPRQQSRSHNETSHVSRSPSMSRSVPPPSHMPPSQQPGGASRSASTSRPSQHTQSQIQSPQRQTHGQQQQRPVSRPQGQIQQHNIQARQQARRYIQQGSPTIPNASSSFQPPTPVTSGILQQQQVISRQADRTRNVIRQRHPRQDGWFTDRFFEDHNCHPYFHNQGDNWWWAPSWAGLSSWLPWGWNDAYYYTDSGYAYSVPPASSDQDDQDQYQNYAQSPQDEWMPLGVFAAGQTAAETAYSTMFVQLAVNKSGDLAGTYYNTATNEVHDLDGQVDQNTQEAAWTVSDNPNSPTTTTGLYNLTQDAAIVQVHFQDGNTQNWTLVRLNK